MTAGSGIQHSEVSTPETRRLHGAQLWVALPDRDRHTAPFFEHTEPSPTRLGDATLRVFIGELGDQSATARVFTPLLGAQLDLPAGASVDLPVDPRFEHGLLVDHGRARLGDASANSDGMHDVAAHELGYVAPGLTSLRVTAGEEPLRALLIGGEPLGEAIVMWWNFIGRTHDEVVEFRERRQQDVIADADRAGRFGHVDGYGGEPLPAPALPGVRLKPRD